MPSDENNSKNPISQTESFEVATVDHPVSTHSTFRIVGIGASAGGLEAFSKLLSHLEIDTGLGFVLIQHLDPNHESFLRDILAKSTAMPVVEACDGMKVEPNNIYVIPPKTQMTLASGRPDYIKLTARRKGPEGLLPIDAFFRSLASEMKKNAIGIVLSGTGSDGAQGVAAIKAAGGITFAQDKESAKFDGMPTAAIDVGVNFTLPPEDIASELTRISKNSPVSENADDSGVLPFEDPPVIFAKILDLLLAARGTDFALYKTPTIQRRIARRMSIHNIESADDYAAYLQSSPSEVDRLYEDLLIKVTSFFRDSESFEALKQCVFPQIRKPQKVSMPLRIWVPGCATGEEAFSIAICLAEFFDETSFMAKIEIFATDISEVALAKARIGEFSENIVDSMSPERLKRFFIRSDTGGYRVASAIRECCVFAKQNVVRDPPFSRMDLISCRNLLIYLAPDLQKRVLSTFHFALNPGGFLFLGNAESINLPTTTDLFANVHKDSKIFSKRQVTHGRYIPDFVKETILDRSIFVKKASRVHQESVEKMDIRSEADRALQAKYMPPGVIINENMEVVQFRGDTSPFILHPPGEVTANLFKMCREGLLMDLRMALHEAEGSGESVRKECLVKSSDQKQNVVAIDVIPFTTATSGSHYFVVLFELLAANAIESEKLPAETGAEITRLQQELVETKEYLNELIAKEQAANEELKTASEEILSANEELQSSNEEMATAKEEVQSANEELITVNEELQSRSQDLARVSSDLANLFNSVQIPIIMISEKLIVRLLTPSAEKILNISYSDVGKSLADIATKLNINGLETLSAEVLETLNTKDQEVQDREGKWYSLRIKPYRTVENRIEGAVIVLIEIDALKRTYAALEKTRNYADAIVQTTPNPILILNQELRIVTTNPAFLSHFQLSPREVNDKKIFDLGGWSSSELRRLLEGVLSGSGYFENFEVTADFPTLERRTVKLNARRLEQHSDMEEKILLAISDITEERRAKDDAQKARESAETANRSKSDFLANMSHEIRTPLAAILGYSELISDFDQPKPDTVQCAGRIAKNVEYLLELIDEILDISKIEAGKLEVEKIRFALLPELGSAFALLQNRANSKGLSFSVISHGPIPESITTCPKRFRQIVVNVVSNAIKFTNQGGVSVAVKLNTLDKLTTQLSLVVTDSGCGMSLQQQERLFQPFSQGDSSVTRKFGGTGLGLILARRLAQALGGDVVLKKSEDGKGSVFAISIDPGPLESVHMLIDITKNDLIPHDVTRSSWRGNNQKLVDMRILLVEDGIDNQLLIKRFLEASGASVEVAANGIEAVEMALAGSYNLVLMDIQMPILDGYEATKRLKSAGYKVPIVALTAHAMRGELEKCLEVGCTDYISKPVGANALVDIVAKFGNAIESDKSILADDPVIGPLVDQFVQNLPKQMAAFRSALDRSDWREISILAHQLSGASGGYGFPELGRIAARIETQTKDSPDAAVLTALIQEFDVKCNRLVKAVSKQSQS